jgi:hypothetical protein
LQLQSSLLSKDIPQVGPLLGGSPGANDKCLLNWLCYRHNNQISVVIEPRLPSFMPGCVLRFMDLMRVNLQKATNLIANGR